ncbi:MAG: CoA transferase [Acidocella sp. 20-63-7]|nr:MAG: CoA transferase [Acidocella sp. 20-63-7]HQT46072.1 CaiB/BaiF CoA-transferase family protein [Acidocella sp.]
MAGPLHGVRVLDLSRVLAGPWSGQVLADLGAEVIKVERPGVGDDTRSWGPPFLKPAEGEGRGESAYFLCANRGKKSVTVDFSRPEGQAIVQRLAARCDIVLENFKVGGLAKLGLGAEDLLKINPRLIYCSITGFGQTGPYRHRAGYDFLMQGMGGLMSLTGEPEGEPMKVGVAVVDVFTGMYAVSAILAALHERASSGVGQHVDIALFDVQIATMANQISSYLVSGEQPLRLGNAHPSIVPYQVFATADGYAILAIGNDEQFRRFVGVAGAEALGVDARFATNPARVANRGVLVPLLEVMMRTRTTQDWMAALETVGVPCGPINKFSDLEEDPQVLARGIFKTVAHPAGGEVRGVASPMRFSRTQVEDERTSPLLGADTEAVLREYAGASAAEIDAWRVAGVV